VSSPQHDAVPSAFSSHVCPYPTLSAAHDPAAQQTPDPHVPDEHWLPVVHGWPFATAGVIVTEYDLLDENPFPSA
jgi:hypothetical protein